VFGAVPGVAPLEPTGEAVSAGDGELAMSRGTPKGADWATAARGEDLGGVDRGAGGATSTVGSPRVVAGASTDEPGTGMERLADGGSAKTGAGRARLSAAHGPEGPDPWTAS